jgi:hypothetical protein
MPLFSLGNTSASNTAASAIALAVRFRADATDAARLQRWLAALSDAELTAAGWPAGDLPMLRSAVADMAAVGQIIETGQPPSTYPQVPDPPYVYENSLSAIIGPG